MIILIMRFHMTFENIKNKQMNEYDNMAFEMN